jgi:uncharacterized protein
VNRLAGASSPYLRQHATNPVDWYPWGPEALERARAEDKPLFVSIGYAACHWCHVMAHESFEDSHTAGDLDRWFVSVKVDREERPDVDAVYMAAVQAMTGGGGWPMSVFCTPDGRPFFAGTYFPPADRHGLPSFRRVVASVAAAWQDRRPEVEAQADALAGAVASEASVVDRLAAAPDAPGRPRWAGVLDGLVATLGRRFDAAWGGFGPAPKFPRPTLVELCLRHHARTGDAAPLTGDAAPLTGDAAPLTMATRTLDAMAAGGIYDHLQGGFARYSTDAHWLVPHFEKMLTDQALLARAYLHAWQATGTTAYLQVATETIDATLETMAVPGGGLCASLDADADGVEGGHAVWTPSEVEAALAGAGMADALPDVCAWYGITAEGNWEGHSIPHRPLGASLQRPPEIEAARQVLLSARRHRPQPARDDKVVTEWNAMFAATLAEAAGACASTRWAEAAADLVSSLFAGSRRPDGRWLRVPVGSDGAAVPGFAGDHAWLVESCTRLSELTGSARWVERAREVADELIDLFWDEATGGVFTTGRDAERLIVRAKDVLDGALPSSNAVAATALLRLAALTGEDRWRDASERIVDMAAPLLARQPIAVADLAPALALLEHGAEIVVTGDRVDLLETVRRHWLPDAVLAWGEPGTSGLWEGREPGAAYVCRRSVCQEPARDPGTLERQLVHLSAEGAG